MFWINPRKYNWNNKPSTQKAQFVHCPSRASLVFNLFIKSFSKKVL